MRDRFLEPDLPASLGPATVSDRLTPAQLDEILALQLTVAWAGEAGGEPGRLGWWKSDLVDRKGGGDLFTRLVPRTAPWAGLILVRAVFTEPAFVAELLAALRRPRAPPTAA